MTLPIERSYAVVNTEQFLTDLLMPSRTPKVPRYVRQAAGRLLKHYPHVSDVSRAGVKCPEVFGKIARTYNKESHND